MLEAYNLTITILLQGFRKIDPEQWEFANDDFVRGQPHLLKNIHRRKPVHSHSLQNLHGQTALSESERQSLKDEIEKLKGDKELLLLELQRHEQEQQGFDSQMQLIKERLQHMEQRQRKMVSFVAQVLQKPGLSFITPQLETNDRKRRLPRIGYLYGEVSSEDNQMGINETIIRENVDGSSAVSSSMDQLGSSKKKSKNIDQLEQLESSLVFWENIVHDAGDAFIKLNSNIEVVESTSCAESPAMSCIRLNIDTRPKSPVIDMNTEPAAVVAPEPVASEEQPAGTTTVPPTGVNDVFWEQFLTENPGSTDAQEVQSERKDSDGRKNENKPADHGKFWWNIKNVNNLAEQMGHLTPAERT